MSGRRALARISTAHTHAHAHARTNTHTHAHTHTHTDARTHQHCTHARSLRWLQCEIIRDWKTQESLQYAFIEFEKKEACEEAFLKMENVLIDDRRIHVDFSQSVAKYKDVHLPKGWKMKSGAKDGAIDRKQVCHSIALAPSCWVAVYPVAFLFACVCVCVCLPVCAVEKARAYTCCAVL